jgi:transposase
MTDASFRVEVITSVQRRRGWSAAEKVRLVEEIYAPGASVNLVPQRHGGNRISSSPLALVGSRKAYTAAAAGEDVVPASARRALQHQMRELHRLLGKTTLQAEILKEALQQIERRKRLLLRGPLLPPDTSPATPAGSLPVSARSREPRHSREPAEQRHGAGFRPDLQA